MKNLSIEQKTVKVISEVLEVSPQKIKPATNLISDLEAESLDLVELVAALEEEFGIEVADQDIAGIQTVADIVSYVEAHS